MKQGSSMLVLIISLCVSGHECVSDSACVNE